MCEIDKNQMRTALHEKYLDRRFPGVLPRLLGKGTTRKLLGKVILEPSEEQTEDQLFHTEKKDDRGKDTEAEESLGDLVNNWLVLLELWKGCKAGRGQGKMG